MKTIGFPISTKENENRRTIIPSDISNLCNPENIYVEKGFGSVLGISDDEYIRAGAHICSHEEVINQDVVCDPKVGDADYLKGMHKGQIIFGWIHATQNQTITSQICEAELSAYAWEKMFEKGRHIFWFNNELAGEAAVIHAFQCYGLLPYGLDVAVIGNGNTARGACKVLNMLGAHVIQYNRNQEELLRQEIGKYNVLVNCILWDVNHTDHIISKSDIKRMKKNAMIIDVSCDRHGGIETSEPTTINNPIYTVEGVLHYVVDHTPAIFYRTFSYNNSRVILPFIEELMRNKPGNILKKSMIIYEGKIIDSEIITHQKMG